MTFHGVGIDFFLELYFPVTALLLLPEKCYQLASLGTNNFNLVEQIPEVMFLDCDLQAIFVCFHVRSLLFFTIITIVCHTGQTQSPRPGVGEHTYAPPLPPHATPTHVSRMYYDP